MLSIILACILPIIGTNCQSAVMAAKAVECHALGPACYGTVAAMYNGPDPALVQSADCDPADPACAKHTLMCAMDPSGPAMCSLFRDDSIESCVDDAQAAGVLDVPVAEETCRRMFTIYG